MRRDDGRPRGEEARTFFLPLEGGRKEKRDQEDGPSGNEIGGICATNLQDKQAFPLGNAFLLSRLSGLIGKTQSNSRLAVEHGPHLGGRPSHLW